MHSTYLDQKYKKGNDNTRIYKRVIEALTYSTDSTQPIIMVKKNEYGVESYMTNEYCKSYRLNETFCVNKIDYYILKNNDFIIDHTILTAIKLNEKEIKCLKS